MPRSEVPHFPLFLISILRIFFQFLYYNKKENNSFLQIIQPFLCLFFSYHIKLLTTQSNQPTIFRTLYCVADVITGTVRNVCSNERLCCVAGYVGQKAGGA